MMMNLWVQVVDTMPVDEKTASFLGYFEPLYLAVEDMPRPPQALLNLRPSGQSLWTRNGGVGGCVEVIVFLFVLRRLVD